MRIWNGFLKKGLRSTFTLNSEITWKMSRCKRVWRIATFHRALFYMQYHCHLGHALLQGHIIVPSNRAQSNFTYCLICSSNEPCHLYPEYIFFTPVIYKLAKWCTFGLSLWAKKHSGFNIHWPASGLSAPSPKPEAWGQGEPHWGCSSTHYSRCSLPFCRNTMHCQFLQCCCVFYWYMHY